MFFGKRFYSDRAGHISGIDILVLSIIKNFDGISGYELIQEINSKYKRLWRASPGTIYPLLNRLAKNGFLAIEERLRNNRELKIYRITEEGSQKLSEVLNTNLESNINSLGDYIRTILQTWAPNEQKINEVMSCFPHCRPTRIEINKDDYTLHNIARIDRIIRDLQFSKNRLSKRLEDIDEKIIYYKDLIAHLKDLRESNMKNIEIVDEDEYNKDF